MIREQDPPKGKPEEAEPSKRTSWKSVAAELQVELEAERQSSAELRAELEAVRVLVADAAEEVSAVTDAVPEIGVDCASGTYSGLTIIAPPGTKRARMARVANRIKDRIQDQRLRGTWTFTYTGLRLRGDRSG